MSNHYQAVGWNRQKKRYDALLLLGLLIYLVAFGSANLLLHPNITAETLLLRGLGTAAILLLHIILCIGPLCRLNRKFLPLLYNRRHMGVTMFFLALAHALIAMLQFHMFGDSNPLVSLFTSNAQYASLSRFPFQPLGFFALVILFLMAATSHDFWLANLTPPLWKSLHIMVYLAYALLIAHVALGILQAETSPVLASLLGLGMVIVITLHLWAGFKECGPDRQRLEGCPEGFVDACSVEEIPEDRAKTVLIAGERVAVFRYDGKISAVSNVCQHQNGPLGEGKIIDGCITCPWHGYQYRPEDGTSPPPFTEKVPTFRVRLERGRIWIHTRPNPPGTRVEPATIHGGACQNPARGA